MGFAPFRWQERLFSRFLEKDDLPSTVDLPTGLGKTSVMAIWYLARQAGANLPRRLVYVVDRRAVVDQATAEAEKIKTKYPVLRISTLRGQHADKGDWLRDPAAEAIIVGTVDMIGSRLLFEGYGVSRKMRPYHAGLLGADTLLVLDESHLVPPFERLLEQVAMKGDLEPKDAADQKIIPRFHLLALSATGRERDGGAFRLGDEDREDQVVKQRLEAKKRLGFVKADDELEFALAKQAWALTESGAKPIRILVYCNSRDVADRTKAKIEKTAKEDNIEIETELFVGARRVRERVNAAEKLKTLGFLSGSKIQLEKPAFVIATSAGEVGVDLDADHMVMDLVPFERIVQRLGRVNRLGKGDARIVVVHEGEPQAKKPKEPTLAEKRGMLAWRSLDLLKKLLADEGGCHDASPGALVDLKEKHGDAVRNASTPEPLYPALSRALVDAWSMTSLEIHTGRPEVQPWLRGWVEGDEPQTTLVWRKFLPVRVQDGAASERDVVGFFEAAPPHLTEKLETRTDRIHKWLPDRAKKLAGEIKQAKTKAEAEAEGAGDTNAADPPPLKQQTVVAIALDRSGEVAKEWTVDDLAEAKEDMKEDIKQALSNATVILDARMGGLSEGGLFDPEEKKAALTPDTDADWEKAIGFRVQSIPPNADGLGDDWLKTHLFDLRRDEEGNPLRQLCVEKYKDATATEEDRSLSPRRAQFLEQHQEWTACKARKLINALGLAGDIGEAIVLAARLHDEGKQAKRWQQAFSAKADGIYAKTTGPFKRSILRGYRHEFGSLAHIEKNNVFGDQPDGIKDLVLHLVAAHHGRARPVIETAGCEDGPQSVLEARAREVALRFARLQKRFGPWGLAWLEAILRAADQQASRANDEENNGNG